MKRRHEKPPVGLPASGGLLAMFNFVLAGG